MADDEHLRESRVASEVVFRGALLDVRRDRVRLPDGREATREYIVHPGAVVVVPLLDDGRLVMERQFRYPLGRVLLELPAGKIDAGEGPLATGVRELAEETGYTAREWARAGLMHNAVGYSDERIEIWFARGLTAGASRLDDGEHLEVVLVDPAELDAMAARGEVTDVKTLVGLLWLQRWRAGAWPLRWQPAP
ncbi:NUDIX hydrolase [Calidifontimicrobium sp. SYSU G02091]|uniref:NUDIX domain-containing protein n=1 Tax=Azohydromonas TaxID=312063 RepID=UPI000E65E4EF|nr:MULTISPECIES: NUDIX hydrolase [Azohydromonas]MCI1192902.1 NUDIX hydrolase [Calidifontimicrobium sp. SYSU G02091]